MTLRHRPHRLIYIPADDRPCSVHWPRLLGRMIDWDVLMPPAELLGWFTQPGKPEEIIAWALEAAREPVDAAVVSLDMLAYGGHVAAQGPWTRTQLAQRRMNALEQLREAIGPAPLMAFGSILGLGALTRSDRLRQHTDALREYSILAAQVSGEADPETRARLQQVENGLPAAVLGEYLAIRGRNHEINRRAIEELARGHLDYLILAQADAADEGLHRGEQVELRSLATDLGVADRLSICGGGPEQGMVLMARAVHQHMNKTPRAAVLYSTDEGAERIGDGEDRPLRVQVETAVANIGATLADADADMTVVVNCPLPVGRDVVCHVPAYDRRRQALAELLSRADEVSGGRGIAVVDAAFSDGADGALVEAVLDHFEEFARLLTATAWSCPASALGVGLAHAAIRLIALQDKGAFDLASLVADLTPMRYLALLDALIESEKAHIELLFSRFVEDWLYHANIRPQVEEHLVRLVRGSAVDLRSLHEYAEEMVRDLVTAAAADLWIERFLGRTSVHIGMQPHRSSVVLADLEETRVRLPWRRLAEVALYTEFSVELAAD